MIRLFAPSVVPWLLLSSVAFAAPSAASAKDPRQPVLVALKAEMARSMEKLRLPKEEPPYFLRYLVRDYDETDISARLGALLNDDYTRARQATVEARVGEYQFDNTADDTSDKMFDVEDFDRYDPPTTAPIDGDIEALRATLWLQTDVKYKRALALLHKKRGSRATKMVEDESVAAFSKEKPSRSIDPPMNVALDRPAWAGRMRRISAAFRSYPQIFDSQVKLNVSHQTRYIVTSEGTELINERLIWAVHFSAVGRAPDGLLVPHYKSFYGASEAELPDEKALTATAHVLADEIRKLAAAPMMDPYNGPAILLPEAAGVFFHEALGHRLEGERQNDNNEGATFKGQIGQPILPTFLTIIDDPTRRTLGTVSLNGYYRFDDEGVAARPVTLVDRGVLRNYLKSRTPVKGSPVSNGHGRSEATLDPMGRMGNTIVRSGKMVPYDQLKQMLLAEIRRQKKDFGLIIADISGGQTNTTTYDFQAFKGMPRIVYKVDAKTGKETLVRGVEFVGTPIGSLNRIQAASNTDGVFNGFCGAESGYVPVSTVAPALLISEIELQRTRRAMERPPILPAPFAAAPAEKPPLPAKPAPGGSTSPAPPSPAPGPAPPAAPAPSAPPAGPAGPSSPGGP
ncbi:MAG TPA: metallopeptidase TldD-related protein [Polyangia bacterium]